MNERIPVLVTTQHRGVFFGYADMNTTSDRTITLTNCRNCIYWARSIGGFLGLASVGPDSNCKIGKQAPLEVVLHDITSVSRVTEEAEKRWNAA